MIARITFGLLIFVLAAASFGQDDEELLPPEEAFAFSSEIDGDELVASWNIADGYYMYQDKFAAVSLTDGVEVRDLILPAGETKDDPLFGEVTVHTERVEVRIPIHADDSVRTAKLEVWSQGCNEPIGVCYPPNRNEVTKLLSFISPASADTAANEAFEAAQSFGESEPNALENLFSNMPVVTADNLLDVDEAFVLNVWQVDGESLVAAFDVTPGYYLYRDKLVFDITGDAMGQRPELPASVLMDDKFFGPTSIYPENFDVRIPLTRASPNPGKLLLTATYQGCAKDLICYPPVTKTFDIRLPSLVQSAFADSTSPPDSGSGAGDARDGSAWWLLLTALGTGILLTFTPCVLPLIPILSSIVVGSDASNAGLRGGVLSIIYVSGTIVAYAAVGAVAGATGDQLQAYFQNAWAISIMSAVFVLMSLSLFGFYEIRLPSAFESRVQESTMRIGGGKAGAVFVLGLLSALVVSACVSPLLISVLGVAIAKADPYLGASMMASMALGMGAILIAIGFGFGVVLPKAGPWMDRLKQAMGVLILAVAIYLLGNIPQVPVLALWAVLFIITGVFLGATQPLPENPSGWKLLYKGLGLVLVFWGALSLIGAVMGNRDVMQPLSQFATSSQGVIAESDRRWV
ncbi:MAG: protein-disulfide reductase DsbD [Acidiferrobacterales bacterium]|nr:protein-disulfide reductase DsbD [Acidiferrobacterales bacterium]